MTRRRGGGLADGSAAALSPAARRLLLGVSLVVGGVTVLHATYDYFIEPMLTGLGANASQSSLMRQLPSLASLFVIFPAGILGDRWGGRRVITWGSTLFVVGSAIVLVAPAFVAVCVGLVLQGAGASAIMVTALGMLSAGVEDPRARASAFAAFAAITPVIYAFAPVMAGALVDHTGWRAIPAMWTVAGLTMVWAARRALPAASGRGALGEMWTPALAGITLVLLVNVVNRLRYDGWSDPTTILSLVGTVVVGAALVVRHRRTSHPTLSIVALRRTGPRLLLVVAIIVPFASAWFYFTVGAQYVYGLSLVMTAAALVPAQLAGVLGAVVTRRILVQWGITGTGIVTMALVTVSLLTMLLLEADSPIWLVIGLPCLYAAAVTSAGIPVTNAIMDTAPPGEESNVAAFRGAAALLGGAIGVALMSALVFGVVSTSLATELRREGQDDSRSDQIAASMRDGATSEDVAAQYSVPVADVDQISEAQAVAMVDGFHAFALAGAACTALALAVFVGARHRDRPRIGAAS